MPGERTRVEAKCLGNAGECRGIEGNIWEWLQSARGMHGNAGECQANVWECKVPGECRGMTGKYESGGCARVTQGNAGEYRRIQGNARGTYGSGCKVPGECW